MAEISDEDLDKRVQDIKEGAIQLKAQRHVRDRIEARVKNMRIAYDVAGRVLNVDAEALMKNALSMATKKYPPIETNKPDFCPSDEETTKALGDLMQTYGVAVSMLSEVIAAFMDSDMKSIIEEESSDVS